MNIYGYIFFQVLLNILNFIIKNQNGITQCILQQKIRINFKEVDELTNTDRSNQGFGSTGIDKPITNFFC